MIKFRNMKWFAVALIYIAFFGLIGTAIYLTKSASPLWALLLTPTFETTSNTDEDKK